jgi:hypothetical protein
VLQAIMLSSYQPAVVARSDLRMVIATQPSWFAESIARYAQTGAELRPCEYDLLGWAPDGAFYYNAICRGETSHWSIDPGSGQSHAVSSSPALEFETIGQSTMQDFVQIAGVTSEDATRFALATLLVNGEVLRSGDGTWIALVCQHIYGPQDVILIETIPE